MTAAVNGVGPEVTPVRDNNMAAAVFFIVFVVLGKLFLINLFTGVIIDTCAAPSLPSFVPSCALSCVCGVNGAAGYLWVVFVFLTTCRFAQKSRELRGSALLTYDQQEWVNTQTKLRAALRTMQQARSEGHAVRRGLLRITKHRYFERASLLSILLNVAVMVQFRANMPRAQEVVLDQLNFAFAVLFCGEMLLKILAAPSSFFRKGSNIFDLAIVVISITLDALQQQVGSTALRSLRILVLSRLFYGASPWCFMGDARSATEPPHA